MRYISSNFSFSFFDDSVGCVSFSPLTPKEAWAWVKEDSTQNIVKPQHRVSAGLAAWATGNQARGQSVRLFESDELLVMYPPQQNQREEWDYCRFILVYIEDSGSWVEEDED